MTAEEKTSLALFLDTAEDSLRDGYRKPRNACAFTGDPPPAPLPLGMGPSREAEGSGESDSKESSDSLESLAAEVRVCTACPLHRARLKAVPGEGAARPLVMVIGEGPGADEDASGRPFVGRAGQLLDKMLASIGLFRERNCFIANVVKCRPPGNRDPQPEEIAGCAPFLARQIRLLQPRLILSAGKVATQALLHTAEGIGRLRGRFAEYRLPQSGPSEAAAIPLLPTYHPSALLRDESLKRPAWEDLKTLRAKLSELDEQYALAMDGSPQV
ncbi:MAG: uracil-DNA glycosylase [Treponema sp.]|jgi:DNA polymerase|nr:uracil-DNA glycosylase [Treponema sp.]